MTDIELLRQGAVAAPDQAANASTDLEHWARQYVAAAQFAQGVCSTLMVPAAYRNKPEEATAAILAGAELGFSPMRSLNAFDNIQGTPAPKAITLRALVQAAGHKVVIVESSDDKAVVMGRRRDETEWQTSTWDIPRAQKLKQYASNPTWKTNPGQMLVARATAEVCRWIGSDAIMGVPYAAEEMDVPAPAAPVARRLTVAELDYPEGFDTSPPTSDDERQAVIREIEPTRQVTREQQRHLFALWGELGLGAKEQREERLTGTAEILGLPSLATFNDLSSEQAEWAIAVLRERKGGAE